MADWWAPGSRRVPRIRSASGAIGRDVDDEIRFHVDARIEDLVRQGVPADRARERAIAEFGDIEQSRQELTQVDRQRHRGLQRTERFMHFLDDLRFAIRSLSRRPSLLAVTTLTLAIGIAANAVMFGVVDQLLLRPPPHISHPEDVRRINLRDSGEGRESIGTVTTYPVLTALREGTSAFSDLSVFSYPGDFSLGTGVEARNVRVQMVSGNWFRLLGVRIPIGRGFTDDEDRIPVGDAVAVLGYGAWQDLFGGDERVVGTTILLQGKTFTVVGVAPRGFSGVDRQRVDLWVPISAIGADAIGDGWHNTTNNWWAQIVGRVRDDVSPVAAAAQATLTYRAVVKEWNDSQRDSTSSIILSSIIATRSPNGLNFESKVALWLLGVAAVVLLIACANVANLLIARTMERQREIAVRLALGVRRGRLVRMLLTEAGVLTLIGSATALLIWLAGSRLVQDVLLPDVVWSESYLDPRVFGFTLGIAVICMLLAGLAPALQAMRTDVASGLRVSRRQTTGGRGRLRFILLLAQTAMSVVLLVGSALTVRSFRNVADRHVGVDRDRVLRVTMPLSRFGFDGRGVEEVYRDGLERVRRIPGVASASVARLTYPMGSASAGSFGVPGKARHDFPGGGPYRSLVTPGFFATIGARIVEGRDFTEAEALSGARALIVNSAVARAYWPDQSAIGQCAIFGRDSTCSTVVGVVENVLQFSLIRDDRALIYAPPGHPGVGVARPGAMLIRITGTPESLIPVIRREMQGIAASMPYVRIAPYAELVAPQLRPWRLGATMFTLFGVIALLIAAIGLYSVMAYWVSQRRHEIGVRMALGARRGDVVRLVAMESMRAVVSGALLGALVAVALSRSSEVLLYETSPRDPMAYLWAVGALLAAAAIASVVPARRSASVDPALVMRAD